MYARAKGDPAISAGTLYIPKRIAHSLAWTTLSMLLAAAGTLSIPKSIPHSLGARQCVARRALEIQEITSHTFRDNQLPAAARSIFSGRSSLPWTTLSMLLAAAGALSITKSIAHSLGARQCVARHALEIQEITSHAVRDRQLPAAARSFFSNMSSLPWTTLSRE